MCGNPLGWSVWLKMGCRYSLLLCLCLGWYVAANVSAQTVAITDGDSAPQTSQSFGSQPLVDAVAYSSTSLHADSWQMSARIDQHIDKQLARLNWTAAPQIHDAGFMRRAYLDLTGWPPRAAEVDAFLQNEDPDKRRRLLAKLVCSPAHATHLAGIWGRWLTPQQSDLASPDNRNSGLVLWLQKRFADNLRYDRLVADLLVSSGPVTVGPTQFFIALDNQPEKIATQTARVFMGVQLDCAQCHDHPFDQWKQQDFWGLAAYFAQITASDPQTMRVQEVVDRNEGEVFLPETDQIVPPKPLVASELAGSLGGTRRQQLTLWLTTRQNPYLARATVNRVWALLMGRGLVEPVDDMRLQSLASHPELLDDLSQFFSESNYDLRKLILAIVGSQAYARQSRHPDGQPPEDSYASMLSKPLTEFQLASCMAQVARQLGDQNNSLQQNLAGQLGSLRGDASQSKLGIVNALVTLHGDLVHQLSHERTSRLIKALQAPHFDPNSQIRWLFMSTLCRPPSIEEQQVLSAEFAKLARSSQQQELSHDEHVQWLSDLLWALLNSSEFFTTP